MDYEEARNKLIPAAMKYADEAVGKVNAKSAKEQKDKWDSTYFKRMDELAFAAGLMPWLSRREEHRRIMELIVQLIGEIGGREVDDDCRIRALQAIQERIDNAISDQIIEIERKRWTQVGKGVR